MIRFIHRLTGTVMYVPDERREEYLSAGHRLAPVPEAKPPARKPRPTKTK